MMQSSGWRRANIAALANCLAHLNKQTIVTVREKSIEHTIAIAPLSMQPGDSKTNIGSGTEGGGCVFDHTVKLFSVNSVASHGYFKVKFEGSILQHETFCLVANLNLRFWFNVSNKYSSRNAITSHFVLVSVSTFHLMWMVARNSLTSGMDGRSMLVSDLSSAVRMSA